jgi:undecaprenyl-diphosphatase
LLISEGFFLCVHISNLAEETKNYCLISMIDYLLTLDEKLLLLINGLNSGWLDSVMFAMTDAKTWSPLFLFIIVFIFVKFKGKGFFILLFIGLVITLGDQISSSLLKPLIGRLRPSHEPHLNGILHLVNNYKGGLFSFVSSHATNSFGVATMLWLLIGKQYRWISIFFVWAAIFSFTRVYLGVHYPSDIIAGAVLGIVLALGVNWAFRKFTPQVMPLN